MCLKSSGRHFTPSTNEKGDRFYFQIIPHAQNYSGNNVLQLDSYLYQRDMERCTFTIGRRVTDERTCHTFPNNSNAKQKTPVLSI